LSITAFYFTIELKNPEPAEYSILLRIERAEIEEKVITFIENDTLFANITSSEFEKPINRLFLNHQHLETLSDFDKMLESGNISPNILGVSGILGQYKLETTSNMIEVESKSLFSLVKALEIK
jgi:hypothetical protein